MNTYLRLSEPGSMVSAGLDMEGVARTILVDSTGRVVCGPPPTSYESRDSLIVICVVFALILGYALGSRPR